MRACLCAWDNNGFMNSMDILAHLIAVPFLRPRRNGNAGPLLCCLIVLQEYVMLGACWPRTKGQSKPFEPVSESISCTRDRRDPEQKQSGKRNNQSLHIATPLSLPPSPLPLPPLSLSQVFLILHKPIGTNQLPHVSPLPPIL